MKITNINMRPGTLVAELVGTFILTTVFITVANPIIVGFTFVALMLALGTVSGAHLNPALTFGLWSIRKIEGIKVPFYFAMQFAGALFALLLSQMYQASGYGLSLASFNSFDTKILIAELIGTATFAFAIAAVYERDNISSAKALCAGLALLTGLAVGGGLLGQAVQSPNLSANSEEMPRVTKVDGAVLNPAIALAATEKTDQQNSLQSLGGQQQPQPSTKRPASRFTWESLIGGLLGSAIGMNLLLVTTGVNPIKKKQTIATKVKTVVKKGKKEAKKATKKVKK